MKRNILFSCIFIYFLVSSCERIIVLDDGDEGIRGLVVNAVATTDTVFMASVSYAYSTSDAPYILSRDYATFEFGYHKSIITGLHELAQGSYPSNPYPTMPGDTLYTWLDYYHQVRDSVINGRYLVKDARVTLTVNEEAEYPMTYEPVSARYMSSYVPRVGDHLRVTAEKNNEKVEGETTVLEPQKIEILDYELMYKQKENIEGGNYILKEPSDSVVRLTLRINDPGNEKNYYRLKVRNGKVGYFHSVMVIGPPYWEYHYNKDGEVVDSVYYEKSQEWVRLPFLEWFYEDVYTSDDVIFYDSRLTRRWGAWEPFMSNVFDDHLINGEEYTIQVDSRLISYKTNAKRFLVVELQSIPEDYYHYLKSMMVYRITSDDDFSENVYVHSNVKNGWGIVGSLSSERFVITLD